MASFALITVTYKGAPLSNTGREKRAKFKFNKSTPQARFFSRFLFDRGEKRMETVPVDTWHRPSLFPADGSCHRLIPAGQGSNTGSTRYWARFMLETKGYSHEK